MRNSGLSETGSSAGRGRNSSRLTVNSPSISAITMSPCCGFSALDDAFEYGADVSVVHGVVRELMEEKRASRQVTVPAVMLEKVMALAGSEMKRLYAVGSENGGDGDAFVREEREAMDVVLQALDGETMS